MKYPLSDLEDPLLVPGLSIMVIKPFPLEKSNCTLRLL
jgi:hypothetical protein